MCVSFQFLCRAEFLKESAQSKTTPSVKAGTSSQNLAKGESSSLTEMYSLPQIKPYVRKRPRDTSEETSSEQFDTSSSSALGRAESPATSTLRQSSSVDPDITSFEIKPYVRKRKIAPK